MRIDELKFGIDSSKHSTNFGLLASGYKGFQVLSGIVGRGVYPRKVVTYDRQDGEERYRALIEQTCLSCGAEFSLSRRPAVQTLDELAAVFVVGWQYLLPKSRKLIILHDSLLPRYRGFAPTATALLSGEQVLGSSALIAGDMADTGPVIAQKSRPIQYPIRLRDALDLQADNMVDICLQIIRLDQQGRLAAVKQDDSLATYSLWRDARDLRIDWNKPACEIRRMVDAMSEPLPGAQTLYEDIALAINRVSEVSDETFERRDSGKVFALSNGQPVVVCGEGLLRIEEAFTQDGQRFTFPQKLRVRFA